MPKRKAQTPLGRPKRVKTNDQQAKTFMASFKEMLAQRDKLKTEEEIFSWEEKIFQLYGLLTKNSRFLKTQTENDLQTTKHSDLLFHSIRSKNPELLSLLITNQYISLRQTSYYTSVNLNPIFIAAFYGKIKSLYTLAKIPLFSEYLQDQRLETIKSHFVGVTIESDWLHIFLLKNAYLLREHFHKLLPLYKGTLPHIFSLIVEYNSPKDAYNPDKDGSFQEFI